ncbi:CPBP family intramembrane glutamic endopeptidase [Natronolimnohabitans innermongolicus]|uniref:CPBP family intramembrane glutamic endopeptidase n=1 Tax=Natronolimnohabitans innermongolicus TaxID=253107 RepID=UPI000A6B207C|nr:CPBP family intramembrane glutamic endopeptidase [Natronolimnohabitans innermongolicus]
MALLPFFGFLVWGGYQLGNLVGGGELEEFLTLARWYVPIAIGLYAFVGAVEVGDRLLEFEARDLLLTSVRDRDLVLGLLLADLRKRSWILIGWTLLLTVAFGVGVGSATATVVVSAAAAALTAASILLGYAVGLAGRVALARLPIGGGVRSLLGGLGPVAVFVVFAAGGMYVGQLSGEGRDAVAELAPDGPPPIPIAYYADFFVVDTPLSAGIGPAAIASAAVVVASVPVLVWAVAALAPIHWRMDRSRAVDEGSDGRPTNDATARAASTATRARRDWPWLATPTGYVADGVLRRAIRRPSRLAHLVYYGMAASFVVLTVLTEGSGILAALGAAIAALGVLLAGGAVGLNPLGDEGSMLDQLVLSAFSPETFVHARLLAGVALGLPLALVGTALLGLGALTPTETLAVGATLVLSVPASGAVALGIGTLLPQSEPGTVLERFESRPPEKLAMFVHGLLIAALVGAAVWLTLADLESTTRGIGLAVVAATTLLAADGSYRFARRGFAEYGRPKTRDPIYALELVAGIGLLGLALSLALESGLVLVIPGTGPAVIIVAAVGSFAGWALAGVAYLLSSGRSWEYLDGRVPTARDARLLAVGIASSLAIYGGFVAITSVLDAPVVEHALSTAVVDGGFPFLLAVLALVVLVNAPVEEFLFRNVVQKRLEETISARRAIAATAALFAVLHVPAFLPGSPTAVAVTLALLAALAVLWGWLYAKTGSVVVPALCHGVYNAVVVTVAFVGAL